ncbi:eukaryotic translation initiation factor 4E-binding protein 1-like [Lineus longissimus]|uniref:eukaryotic translation initiation factor 4E-binding protein 1-like n=1 Tax=Lineus longissimus TaxID=88925 RepID=UPI002B4EBA48
MSGMDAARQSSNTREIPTRRVLLTDDNLPSDYSTTPGGTMFSTTPGGTRIVYHRNVLMKCRKSPLAQTPPKLPIIPGVTAPGQVEIDEDCGNENEAPVVRQNGAPVKSDSAEHTEEQFEMDI